MREIEEIVLRNLLKLKKEEIEIIDLVWLKGKTLSKASKILKVPRTTLKYRLDKGLVNLREKIIEDIGWEKIMGLLSKKEKIHDSNV